MAAPSAGTAYVDIRGDFSTLNKQVSAAVAPLTSKFGKLGTAATVGLAGVAVGAVAAGKALYDIGSQFDDAYDTIQTRTGQTGKHLGRLKNDFKNVVSAVPVDFADAATAVSDLSRELDISGKPLRRLSKQVLALSKVTGEDLAGEIPAITRLFGDWSVKTGQQAGKLDELFRLTQQTGIEFTTLSELMVQFGSPLRQLGFSFEESAVMFGKFQKEGVNLQTLLPGLRFALKNIALPTDDLRKQFQKLGVTAREPHDALMQIFDALSSRKVKEADKTLLASSVFGGRAWADMKAAVEEGRFAFGDLIRTMEHGHGTIRGTEKSTRDASENFKIMSNRLKVLLEPVATAVFKAVGNLSLALTKMGNPLKALQRALGLTSGDVKAIGKVFGAFAEVMRRVMRIAVDQIKAFLQGFKGSVAVIRGVVKLIGDILHGDFSAAWKDVKAIFRGGAKLVLATMRGMTAPVRGLARAIGDGMEAAFGGALDRVVSLFEGGANAILGIVQKIADVINIIPGVPDIHVPRIGSGGTHIPRNATTQDAQHPGGVGRAQGGPINVPMVMVGEEAPKHPEWVIATNPAYRDMNLRYWAQAGKDLGVPGFAFGGPIGSAVGGAASAVGGAVSDTIGNVVNQGASYFIGKLPKPDLPAPFGGLGKYLVAEVTNWIRDGFTSKKLGKFTTPGIGGFTGPPPGFQQLGDPAWVDAHTLRVASYVASKYGLSVTSGYRSPGYNASIGGAVGSLHTHGSAANPGAVDISGPGAPASLYAPKAFYGKHVAGLEELLIDNVAGWNLHAGFFARGGKIPGLFDGGNLKEALTKRYPRHKGAHSASDPDYIPYWLGAALFEHFGMPGITMAKVSYPESWGRTDNGVRKLFPGALGDDAAAGFGNTFGLGLLQITTGVGNDDTIRRHGGVDAMFIPTHNAGAGKELYDYYRSSGSWPWFGHPAGNEHYQGKVKVGQILAGNEQSAAGEQGVGGGGGKEPPDPSLGEVWPPIGYVPGWIIGLHNSGFGDTPNHLPGVVREIGQRRRELAMVRSYSKTFRDPRAGGGTRGPSGVGQWPQGSRTAPPGSVPKLSERAKKWIRAYCGEVVSKLTRRIDNLLKQRNALIRQHRKRIGKWITRMGELPAWQAAIARLTGDEGRIAVDQSVIDRILNLEPEEFATEDAMQKYLGIGSHANEAGSLGAAYNRLLGDDFALRNLYAGAEGAGLTRISTVIHPAIHGINRDIHTTERAIDAETRKPPAKRNHGLLARLRDRITTLKRRRGQWETSETNLTGTLIPDFVSGLVSQQGPGLTHAVLSSVPDMEFFGGSSELFNVLRDIRDLNLRKFEQPDTSDASGDGGVGDAAAAEDNARNDQLLELYKSMLEAAQREIAVQRIEAPIAAQYPVMHDGGIFHAPGGAREGLALLEEGERVTPAGAGDTEFHFHFDPATGRAWVEQIVDGKLERTVRAVSGGAPMGRSTAYG